MEKYFFYVFSRKCTYLEKKKKGENAKFDVKLRNFGRMTISKRSSEIVADEKTFWGESHTEKFNLRNIS